MRVEWVGSEAREIPGVGVASPGAVLDMDEATARKFIASKDAKPVDEVKPKVVSKGGEDK